tara:strand:- start:347 stop:532 length:186 start_codon:yes stop_codon:yes gene_type:complete
MAKELTLVIKMTDDQYDIVTGESQSMDMSIEELFANTLAVVISEIQESVKVRNALPEAKEV